MRKLTDMQVFPFIPVVPLVVAGTIIALEIYALRSLRRLARRLDALDAERMAPAGV
jgi:hypothetical protein